MGLFDHAFDSERVDAVRRIIRMKLRDGVPTVRAESLEAEDSTGAVAVRIAGDGRFQAGECPGFVPEDLTARGGDVTGEVAYHDGTDGANVNAEGPATFTSGGSWVSLVDGGTIA